MLDDLIVYLRAALAAPARLDVDRWSGSSKLASAYLNIMQVHLGERLAFDIDGPRVGALRLHAADDTAAAARSCC